MRVIWETMFSDRQVRPSRLLQPAESESLSAVKFTTMANTFLRNVLLLFMTFTTFCGCLKSDDKTIALPEIGTAANVIPPEIRTEFESKMDIHEGTNPPDISCCFVISPERLYFATDKEVAPSSVKDEYVAFYNKKGNTYEYHSKQGDTESHATNVVVIGSGNNFTAYFTEETKWSDGESWLIKATLLSGTITSRGIEDLKNAFIALEVNDPYDKIMEVNEFRIFYDYDNVSLFTDWEYTKSLDSQTNIGNSFDKQAVIKTE